MMPRFTALFVLLALLGCDRTDPYLRDGVWHPNGANQANLRAMVALPSSLFRPTFSSHGAKRER